MALAIAPWEERTRWWDERARLNAGIPLEDIAAKHNFSNNHEPEPQMEVDWDSTLREIDLLIFYNNLMESLKPLSPEEKKLRQNHWESVNEFNVAYSGKGIEAVVQKNPGLFGIAGNYIGNRFNEGLRYAANGLGKAFSLLPAPARRALVPAGLIVPLLATACLGSKPAYADVALTSSNVSYNPESNLASFIIVADYTSENKKPVEGIVSVYLDGDERPLVSQRGILNPEKGTDFIVEANLPPGNYNFRIQVDVPGIKEDNYGNNIIKNVKLNATPTAVEPTVTPVVTAVPTATPTATATPVPTATPTITPTPTLEAKLFEFVCNDCTPEQYETARKNALEDYRAVLKVYGIKEEDGRVKFIVDQQGYSVNFFLGNKFGGAVGGLDDLLNPLYRQRGTKHETAHAINHTLFPTKNNIEPWYNTFDEGSAQYASGEVEAAKPTSTILREDDGSLKDYNWMKAIDYLISTPNKFWDRVDPPDNAGWLTGQVLYLLLEHEGLTPEKNAVAIKKLTEYYMEPSTRTNKEMIQSAYESALGKSLNHLFDTWLEPGIKRFYVTSTSPPR